jgi:hypothetical protein
MFTASRSVCGTSCVMVTDATGFCLQQAEMFVALPHSGNDKGVSFESAVEFC